MTRYSVILEVAGPLAMFARPDTGGTPISYPGPTRSAARGILEAIAYVGGPASYHPTCVEVCRRVGTPGGAVRYQSFVTNYKGPLRKSDIIREGAPMQLWSTVVVDVCYRIYADIHGETSKGGDNWPHHLQSLFVRRLRQGRCYRTPCLGLSELTCTYWGEPRPDWEVDDALNTEIPSMLLDVWDSRKSGAYAPTYMQRARIVNGVLTYAQ
jgi:CRISPR-associated protein Cas5d